MTGTATITGYTGESTVMNIPSKVTGIRTLNSDGTVTYNDNGKTYKVVATTGNSGQAMSGTDKITTVIIPDTIETIGDGSFYECTNLKKVEISDTSNLAKIGDYAFDKSSLEGDLVIPNKVTTIGQYAFRGTSISTLEIPNSVTTVGQYVFQDCSQLKSVTFEEDSKVDTISVGMFLNCTALSGTIEIPASVETIETYAFKIVDYDVAGTLQPKLQVTFENGSNLKTIEKEAFCNCTHLTGSLTIPASVETIGEAAFKIADYYHYTVAKNLTPSLQVTFENGSNLKTIEKQAFYYCTHLTGSLIIPASVETIGNEAFKIDHRITLTQTVNFAFENGSELTTLGEHAFYNCQHLAGPLVIPKGVKQVNDMAFYLCRQLTSLTFEAGSQLETIRPNAFNSCKGLKGNLEIPATVTSIGNNAFCLCSSLDGTLTIPSGVTKIENETFSGCTKLSGTLTIPSGVTSIGVRAFNGCGNLEGTLTIPSGVTEIGESAFNDCGNLTGTLTIPSGVTKIEASTFSGCEKLSGELNIPSAVTSIGDSAFSGCYGFTGLTFADNSELTTIATKAFNNCYGLQNTIVTIPATVTSIGDNAFAGTNLEELLIPNTLEVSATYGLEVDYITQYTPSS